uniref:Uncharacterized protein n=1 Tax=Anguilla anguilla TaxID=7936 RepID=A0A0E9VRF2_ANGAN
MYKNSGTETGCRGRWKSKLQDVKVFHKTEDQSYLKSLLK